MIQQAFGKGKSRRRAAQLKRVLVGRASRLPLCAHARDRQQATCETRLGGASSVLCSSGFIESHYVAPFHGVKLVCQHSSSLRHFTWQQVNSLGESLVVSIFELSGQDR